MLNDLGICSAGGSLFLAGVERVDMLPSSKSSTNKLSLRSGERVEDGEVSVELLRVRDDEESLRDRPTWLDWSELREGDRVKRDSMLGMGGK